MSNEQRHGKARLMELKRGTGRRSRGKW